MPPVGGGCGGRRPAVSQGRPYAAFWRADECRRSEGSGYRGVIGGDPWDAGSRQRSGKSGRRGSTCEVRISEAVGPAVIGQSAGMEGCAKSGSRQRHDRCPLATAEGTRVRRASKSSTVNAFLVRAVIPAVLGRRLSRSTPHPCSLKPHSAGLDRVRRCEVRLCVMSSIAVGSCRCRGGV